VSANGYLIDRATRHQIFIQRFASGQVTESLPILRRMLREIRAALALQDLTSFQTARLIALQLDITTITTAAGVSLGAQLVPSMRDFAAYEAQFTTTLLQGAVSVQLAGVSAVALGSAVTSAPVKLVSGQKTINTTFAGLFDTFAGGAAREVMTAVQAGITAGDNNASIVQQVTSLVNTRTRAQAETVVRTAANAAGSVARNEVYAANADVLQGEEWVATLDSRTRIEHAALDGKKYPVGQGPQTPLGYNCRCIRVPVVAEKFAALREGATRASYQGPVSAQRTYGGWLRDQPESFHVEVLGPQRAELFRSGGLSLDKFADDGGRLYTLEQLRAREGITLE
jgi:SPP1 gp7 family putative phage head morphogenesis protein